MVRATRIITCVCLLALAVSLPLSEHEERLRNIYEPWFNEPDTNTTWIAGHDYDVQWNTDGAPPVTNECNATLSVHTGPHTGYLLVEGFKLSDGHVVTTAPRLSGKYRLGLTFRWWDVRGPEFTFIINDP